MVNHFISVNNIIVETHNCASFWCSEIAIAVGTHCIRPR